MANEITTTSADDLSYAAQILAADILENFYGNNIAAPLVRKADIGGFPSRAKDFPISPALAAASLAEGVDMANTAFSTTKVTITAAEVGLLLTITDLLSVSDIVGDEYYAGEAGKALASKFTTDVLALASGFSQQCGATTVDLTETNIIDGLVLLQAGGVSPPYVAALHPRQWGDLVGSMGSYINQVGSGSGARAESNDVMVSPDGGLGRLYGVSWYISHLVPTATAGADRLGMIVAPQYALGHVEKWAARVEFERDASLRAREIALTACYGLGELRDAAGIGVLTDA